MSNARHSKDAPNADIDDTSAPFTNQAPAPGGTMLGVAPVRPPANEPEASQAPHTDVDAPVPGLTVLAIPALRIPTGTETGADGAGPLRGTSEYPAPGETLVAVAPVSTPASSGGGGSSGSGIGPAFPSTYGGGPRPPPPAGETMVAIPALRPGGFDPAGFNPAGFDAERPTVSPPQEDMPGGTIVGIRPVTQARSGNPVDVGSFGTTSPPPSPTPSSAPKWDAPGRTMVGISPIAPPSPAPQRRSGPPPVYEIIEHLGGGESGEVFHARHREDGSEVALRIIRPALADDPNVVATLRDVVTLAQQAQHPHLGRQLALDETASPTLILELVQGQKLSDLMSARGRAPAPALIDLGLRLSSALAVAHGAGLAHGNVHAGNVVLEPGTGRWVLLDLGHAYATRPLDPSHDLYALAAMLYVMATGQSPFGEEGADIPDPREFTPDLPASLADLLLLSLSSDPAQWFGSAIELSRALAASRQVVG